MFLMPFSHFLRIPPDLVLPAWWTWFILIFAVAIGSLYEVFEFRHCSTRVAIQNKVLAGGDVRFIQYPVDLFSKITVQA